MLYNVAKQSHINCELVVRKKKPRQTTKFIEYKHQQDEGADDYVCSVYNTDAHTYGHLDIHTYIL